MNHECNNTTKIKWTAHLFKRHNNLFIIRMTSMQNSSNGNQLRYWDVANKMYKRCTRNSICSIFGVKRGKTSKTSKWYFFIFLQTGQKIQSEFCAKFTHLLRSQFFLSTCCQCDMLFSKRSIWMTKLMNVHIYKWNSSTKIAKAIFIQFWYSYGHFLILSKN